MEIMIERSSLIPTDERRVPTLSLKSYTEGSRNDQVRFINELFRGIKDYGFIILRDHNVSEELLSRGYELSRAFFSLPVEIKMAYAKTAGGQRGYTPYGTEHAKDSPVMDLKEFWHVGRDVGTGSSLAEFYPENIWPSEIADFRETFEKIYLSLEQAGGAMLEALTFSLGVPPNYFDRMINNGNSILRLLHYPPIPDGVDPRCIRAAAHEDINLITILPAATASGLQLLDRNGEWLDVQGEPGSLIVDAADMLSRITNDVIPSTTHRVINPQDGRNESRYSMPFFMHPHPKAMLSCIPSCRGRGAKYPDIKANDFLLQRLVEIGLLHDEGE